MENKMRGMTNKEMKETKRIAEMAGDAAARKAAGEQISEKNQAALDAFYAQGDDLRKAVRAHKQ